MGVAMISVMQSTLSRSVTSGPKACGVTTVKMPPDSPASVFWVAGKESEDVAEPPRGIAKVASLVSTVNGAVDGAPKGMRSETVLVNVKADDKPNGNGIGATEIVVTSGEADAEAPVPRDRVVVFKAGAVKSGTTEPVGRMVALPSALHLITSGLTGFKFSTVDYALAADLDLVLLTGDVRLSLLIKSVPIIFN